MTLCIYCQSVDFRRLLLQYLTESASGPSRTLRATTAFHSNIFSLRSGSDNSCVLCNLIWAEIISQHDRERTLYYYNGPDRPLTDEELAKRYEGPLFLSVEETGGKPMKVRFRVHGEFTETDSVFSYTKWSSTTFELFPEAGYYLQDQDDILGLLVRDIPVASSSEPCLSVAKEWLDNCLLNNSECGRGQIRPHKLPTRVIDVKTITENPRVYVTNGVSGSWAALSYCWGGDSTFTLTSNSIVQLQKGLPLEEFPLTIREAIVVTRSLGLQYLWVDAICILQDSQMDWAVEAANMSQVYAHADVVIAATASTSVHTGLFTIRPEKESCQLSWNVPEQDNEQRINARLDFLSQQDHSNIEKSFWATRGWTMQEDLLAERKLSFTSGQILWECLSLATTESGHDIQEQVGVAFPLGRDGVARNMKRVFARMASPENVEISDDEKAAEDPFVIWYQIATQYSKRNLTYSKDRFTALFALASFCRSLTASQYVFGLWKSDLLYGLLWSHIYYTPSLTDNFDMPMPTTGAPYSINAGPSWSWLSLEGSLQDWPDQGVQVYDVAMRKAALMKAKILDVQTDISASSGRLVIEAPCFIWEAPFTLSSEAKALTSSIQLFIVRNLMKECTSENAEFKLRHEPYDGQHFAVIQIMQRGQMDVNIKLEFLVLESVKSTIVSGSETDKTPINVYRRIGKCTVRRPEKNEVREAEGEDEPWKIGLVERATWKDIEERPWETRIISLV